MSGETLGRFFSIVAGMPRRSIHINWHGGEPLLAGISFFREVVRQEAMLPTKQWDNAVQTNAVLITDEWAKFFKEHNFHIGVSIDGNEATHDLERIICQE